MTATTDRAHGYAKYKLENCRCYTCAYAVSEYNRRRDRAIAEGRWRVDVGSVRVHLRSLMLAGMGYKRVAQLAGVNVSTVARILYGRQERGTPPPATTRYDIAEKLLAVHLDLHPNAPIEATGTARRIQALVACGYTLTEVAGSIGWTLQNLSRLVYGGSVPFAARVELRTAQAVGALYDRLSMQPPTVGATADRSRVLARRRGWFPPLAWDDEQIDDPTGVPCLAPPVDGSDPDVDELSVQHAIAGHEVTLNSRARAEVVRRLTVAGFPAERIAALAGTTAGTVSYLRSRHGLNTRVAVA